MGVSVTLGNARTLIENAIVDSLAWAYSTRSPAVADIATLRAAPSAGIPNKRMRVVTANGGFAYQWQTAQLAADDGANFIQPTDVPGGLPGRWCKASSTGVTSTATSGYLASCDNYNDDSNDLDIFMQRVFGDVPALLLSFERIEREHKSTGVVGALDWCKAHFTLFAVSFNARGRQAARQGSPVPAEAVIDPGTAAILGDAMIALKGAALGIDDVAYVSVGDEYTVIKDLARGHFVDALDLTVFYTETLPDPTLVPVTYPYSFNVNYKSADLNQAGALDTSNDVTAGLQFPLGDGLTKTFASGSINFNGTPLAVTGAAHTFPASSVVYRDISSTGVITYTSTNFGDPSPPIGFGLVRLGVTATDATGVRLDRLLAAVLVDMTPALTDKVDPPALVSIAISPTSISIPTGTPVQFTATGTYDDGTTPDITALVTWQSDNANTSFTPSGVANTSAPGVAHITATLVGKTSNTTTLTAT